MADFVFGTAAELRRLADQVDEASDGELPGRVSAAQSARIDAISAKYPGTSVADLAGRIFCGDVTTARPRGRTWHVIKGEGGITADVYLYAEIGEWGVTAADFVQQLAAVAATDITLHLNSPGGEVFEGFAIRNALRDHQARITVRVDALAASIASVIAMAGDRVVMNRQAQMMIHDASGLVIGNSQDMRQMADVLDKISNEIAKTYAGRAGGTPGSWRKAMLAETWYTAEETVAAGLADEAVAEEAEPAVLVAGPKPLLTAVPRPAHDPDPDPYADLAAVLGGLAKEAVS